MLTFIGFLVILNIITSIKKDKMKLKTNKSAAKRVKIKKSCLSRKHAYKRHLLRNKSTKQLRRLSGPVKINAADIHAFKRMLCLK
jgi:ribosomal protein L35